MATKPSVTPDAASADPDGDTSLLDTQSAAVKRLMAKGKERGYITFIEAQPRPPAEQTSSSRSKTS